METKHLFHPLHSFLKTRLLSSLISQSLPGTDLQGFSSECFYSELCVRWVYSRIAFSARPNCSIYAFRETSRSGNGIFKWGCLSFLWRPGVGTSPLIQRLQWGESGEVNLWAPISAQFCPFSTRGYSYNYKLGKLILGQCKLQECRFSSPSF